MMNRVVFSCFFSCLVLLVSCQENSEQKEPVQQEKPDLIEENKAFLKKERERIEAFIEGNGFDMQRTGSGLYYMTLSSSDESEQINEGDVIEYAYRISLLDGTPVANSTDNGKRTIKIGKDQVLVGLAEAFELMQMGQRYLFIFPAHLAHGLASNEDQVPPRSALIYELEPLNKLN